MLCNHEHCNWSLKQSKTASASLYSLLKGPAQPATQLLALPYTTKPCCKILCKPWTFLLVCGNQTHQFQIQHLAHQPLSLGQAHCGAACNISTPCHISHMILMASTDINSMAASISAGAHTLKQAVKSHLLLVSNPIGHDIAALCATFQQQHITTNKLMVQKCLLLSFWLRTKSF